MRVEGGGLYPKCKPEHIFVNLEDITLNIKYPLMIYMCCSWS